MSTTQITIPSAPEVQDLATVPTKFEVTPIPVPTSTARRRRASSSAGCSTSNLGFAPGLRAVQLTPPGPRASIQFAPAGPAPLQRLLLVVDDRRHRGHGHL